MFTRSRVAGRVIGWTHFHTTTWHMDFVKLFNSLLDSSSIHFPSFDGC